MDRPPTTARLHNSEEFRAQFAIHVLYIAGLPLSLMA